MKRMKLLRMFFVVALAMWGAVAPFEAKADTSLLSTTDGWQKLTAIPNDPSQYYFAFVDNTNDLMLAIGEGVNQSSNIDYKTMVYRTSTDPAMNPAMLWTLEAVNNNYAIKSAVLTSHYIQTENNAEWYCRTHDNGGGSNQWYQWTFAFADGSWTIKNGKYPDKGFIGPWNAAAFSNGQEVAANKTADAEVGHFQIYAILKSNVDWESNASETKPANYSYKIVNSYAAFDGTSGWTGTDTNTRNSDNGFDGVKGFFEFCNWDASSWSGSLSQTISDLPAGKYLVRAAGQLHAENTVMTLEVNATSKTFPANGTTNGSILSTGQETTAGNGVAGWQWVSVETSILSGASLTITISSSATAQYRWANVDNVELYYLGPVTNVFEQLQAALATYAPYSDVTDATDYTTHYNSYAAYTQQTSQSDMLAAITYMQENYSNYQWANASIAHPVDVTVGIISGWECTSNDSWPGSGRTTATGTYYDGTSRTYFTQNHEDGAARAQTVTIPKVGAYLLRTIVRPVAADSYATISIGDESVTTRDVQTGTDNIGNGWAYNDIYFATTSENTSKTISIALSNVNNSREADCGEMHLLYIGQSADFVKDGVHRYIGSFATAPSIELTDEVPVANTAAATFTSGTATVAFTNPNGLVFANSGQVSNTVNVVIDGTCATLQLASGHPFVNPAAFTATSASYTLGSGALADGRFATLMVPFAANIPSGGQAYTLDQGVNLFDGNVRGTAVGTIAANSPVLVTAAGEYTGSGVSVSAVAAGATFTSGELVGTYTATTAPQGSYVLQNHTAGEGVAFYLVGSTRPTVNPFRAYIKPQASNVKAFTVQFDATGIVNVNDNLNVDDNWAIFNLSGQRLSKLQHGVNIINGKKVMVK